MGSDWIVDHFLLPTKTINLHATKTCSQVIRSILWTTKGLHTEIRTLPLPKSCPLLLDYAHAGICYTDKDQSGCGPTDQHSHLQSQRVAVYSSIYLKLHFVQFSILCQ